MKPDSPKETLWLQLADDQARLMDLMHRYPPSDLSVKQEKDKLRRGIEVKWALLKGIQEDE